MESTQEIMHDALGKEIVIGKTYGYSHRSNGTVTVVIGKASKINKNSVTLEVIKRARSIYNDKPTEEENFKKTASVAPNTIFQLDNIEDQWF